jgi:hypothetical protein
MYFTTQANENLQYQGVPMNNRISHIAVLTIAVLGAPALAQDDGSEIILPLEAQTCNTVSAPASIPEQPTMDDLLKAQGNIKAFQAELLEYRTCLDESRDASDLTDGNQIALNQAHDFTVDMETRVAAQFNYAVCEYKESQGEKLSDTCKDRLSKAR